jgi:hypothetical protein
MPHWMIKSAIHRAISFLPQPQRWNEIFQKYATKSVEVGARIFESRLNHCREHLDYLFGLRPEARNGFRAVELGTGWHPILPLGMFLCGATDIWTFDIDPLLKFERLEQVVELYKKYFRAGRLKEFLPLLREDRAEQLCATRIETPKNFLEKFNIYLKVQDAQKTGLESHSIDFIYSHGVLEYIPRPVLVNIFQEFKRIGRNKFVMSHSFDLTDQYHYFDHTITPHNFLRYTERQWRYLNSPLIWQNRLRISDYRQLFRETGFEIVKETSMRGAPEDLDKVKLASEFQRYKREDLLVTRSWLVAVPASE